MKIVPRSAPALRMVIATQRGCASVTLGTAESSAILATARLAKNAEQDATGVPHATRMADAVAMGLASAIPAIWVTIVLNVSFHLQGTHMTWRVQTLAVTSIVFHWMAKLFVIKNHPVVGRAFVRRVHSASVCMKA